MGHPEVGRVMETVYRSEDFSPPERVDAWEAAIARSIMPLAMRGTGAQPFTGTARQVGIGPAGLSQLVLSPHQVIRSPALVRRADPELYTVALTLRGSAGMSQAGRDTVTRPGDLLLYDSSLPFTRRSARA
jgi:hypothetical protein